jgi:hypothetical protein
MLTFHVPRTVTSKKRGTARTEQKAFDEIRPVTAVLTGNECGPTSQCRQ